MAGSPQNPVSEHGGSGLNHETDFGAGMILPEEHEAYRLHLSQLSALLRQLLKTCIEKHFPTCVEFPKDSVEARFLPKGVIDVGPVEELRMPCLRDTEEESIEDRRYIALSHVWGNPSGATWQAMTTAVTTLAARKKGIIMSTLPKVFQDAMVVCRHLGMRYLWIDSLCILQDSGDDWKTQSAVMGQIYELAVCTIAANVSETTQGLFSSSSEDLLSYRRTNLFFQSVRPDMLWSYLIDGGPLNGRAWCLQERYLSRRMLSVHDSNRWIWECDSCIGLGQGYFGGKSFENQITNKAPYKPPSWIFTEPKDGLFRRQTFNKQLMFVRDENLEIYNRWQDVMSNYSNRKMTKESDKLPSLSGLAHKFADITGDTYLAGLWKNDIARGLLWMPWEGNRISPYYAPTWSWCSVSGPVLAGRPYSIGDVVILYDTPEPKSVIEFLMAELLGDDHFHGLLPGSSLKLLGMIEQPGKLHTAPDEYCDPVELRGRSLLSLFSMKFDDSPLQESLLTKGLDIWFFPIMMEPPYPRKDTGYIGLMLLATGVREGEYRRIGLFEARVCPRETSGPTVAGTLYEQIIFDHSRRKEITLV